MNKQKLDKWAELLLDTGKRNNLVNFRDTRLGSVDILLPNFSAVFDKADNGATLEAYAPAPTDEEAKPLRRGKKDEAQTAAPLLTKEQYVETYGGKIKRINQILVYNPQGNAMLALRNIGKRARSAIEETGVNVAYVALGFVNMKERHSNVILRAPILLAPVTIESKSSVDPCYVKVTDDIILNPTLAFKLQNEFSVTLPDYNDEGMAYFKKFEGVVRRLGWTVAAEAKIGVFSFQKINMYRDIKDNGNAIAKSITVRALNGDPVEIPVVTTVQPDAPLHNIVDADSSQAAAIRFAREGRSFVLQGPPGTGKSQTITNIIAECLASGKKVLFVAEKLAALNVVFDKLKAAGLDEFCLQLHSHKANKKDVIEELAATLRLQPTTVTERAAVETAALVNAQKQLDEYVTELHVAQPVIGKSVYEMSEIVASFRDAPQFAYPVDVTGKGADYIEAVTECLAQFAKYEPTIGYDYRRNVWYGYKNVDTSYQNELVVKSQMKAVKRLCTMLVKLSAQLQTQYMLTLDTIQSAQNYRKLFKAAGTGNVLTPSLLSVDKVTQTIELVKQMQQVADVILQARKALDEHYDNDVYALDGKTVHKRLKVAHRNGLARAFSHEYKKFVKQLQACRTDGVKIKYADVLSAYELLATYQTQKQTFAALEAELGNRIACYNGLATDWAKVLCELGEAQQYMRDMNFGTLSRLSDEQFVAAKNTFNSLSGWLDAAFCDESEINQLFANYQTDQCDIAAMPLATAFDKATACTNAIEQLDNWCRFRRLTDKLTELGVIEFVNKALDNRLPLAKLDRLYGRLFYGQWIDVTIRNNELLNQLSRIPHDKLVDTFAEKDRLQFAINQATLKAELSAMRPDLTQISPKSQVSALLREAEKKRKQKGIRSLLSDTWELAQTLKPCFLMSPLSVSTFLAPNMTFDVVIFDEASQIFPQDAVGAIYRGKQLIVVGDAEQMPPSNFFTSIADTDNEDEEDDIDDYESILDLCATTLPQMRLKWHYRSRFEQLIAFSNKNYYDNDLVTFPSAQKDKKGCGVDYYFVAGVFDRTARTNRIEAEYVVDLVFDNLRRYPDRSLGVVTFSASQQDLVDRLIARRRRDDPSYEEYFRTNREEPFFVKNLETVQGDERDTIILDVAYGRDQQGKLLLNFGPLNRAGGERRLNVAVTRAKINVQVVSGMHAADIDLSKTQSVGVRLLREYLDYAEHGTGTLARTDRPDPFGKTRFDLEGEICEFLRKNGYDADTKVGCSDFKVDIAVKPQRSANYVLAVECDGATYQATNETRDRDRLRKDILERMGWHFYRVWSTDWFRNKRVEQENLLNAVKQAAEQPKVDIAATTATKESFESRAATVEFQFDKYVYADIDGLRAKYPDDIQLFVKSILEVEAPISEDLLLKRIVGVFGRTKVTANVVNEWNESMRGCAKHDIVRKKGFLYIKGQNFRLRVAEDGSKARAINDIAVEELAAGLLAVVKHNVAVEKTALYNFIAQQLGCRRAGDAMTNRLNEAFATIKKQLTVDGDVVSVK